VFDCDKCGKDNKPLSFTVLGGQFATDLCSRCINAWSEFYKKSDEFKRQLDNSIEQNKLDILIDAVLLGEQQEKLTRIQADLDEATYNLAKGWVNGNSG